MYSFFDDPMVKSFMLVVIRRCLLLLNTWIENTYDLPDEKRVTKVGKVKKS